MEQYLRLRMIVHSLILSTEPRMSSTKDVPDSSTPQEEAHDSG